MTLSNDDPFPADPTSPEDTKASCSVNLDDFGEAGSNARLIDTCSYPSASPTSNAFDCIVYNDCNTNADCNDGIDCTTDVCDATKHCVLTPVDSVCSNGVYCDGAEFCQAGSGCVSGTAPVCPDNDSCNGVEICDETTDSCTSPEDLNCDDGNPCTDDSTVMQRVDVNIRIN